MLPVGTRLRLGHLCSAGHCCSPCLALWLRLGGLLPSLAGARAPSGWCFAPQATEDQIKLLRLQRHLQEDFDKPYLDLSLHDTVSNLILDGHHKRAEQLYREFKIPDKRWVPGRASPGGSPGVAVGGLRGAGSGRS